MKPTDAAFRSGAATEGKGLLELDRQGAVPVPRLNGRMRWLGALRDLPIVWRCIAAPLLGVVVLALVWSISVTTSRQNDVVVAERDRATRGLLLVTQMQAAVGRIRGSMHRAVAWRAAGAADADVSAMLTALSVDAAVVTRLSAQMSDLVATRDGQDAFGLELSEFLDVAHQVRELVGVDSYVVNFFVNGLEASYAALERRLGQLQSAIEADRERTSERMVKTMESGLVDMQLTIALFMGIFLLVSLMLGRSIARPISDIVAVLGELRRGNLEVDCPHATRRDEIGRVAGAVIELRENLRLTRALEQQRDAAMGELKQQAHCDGLTGLGNRALFRAQMERAFRCGLNDGAPIATGNVLMLLDLDRFKEVNDTLGHDAGDQLLCEVARRLTRTVRPGDGLFRLGGDEFAVILERLGQELGAMTVADRILAALREPFHIAGTVASIGASIGITLQRGTESEPRDVARHADLALYQAKAAGRDCYRFFHDEMNLSAERRRSIERGLRQALRENMLSLLYQPQWTLDGERLAGLEALLRWHHPTEGTILPAGFLAIAEQTGLIIELGDWVLVRVFDQIASWRAMGIEPPPISINISPVQLRASGFLAHARSLMESATPTRPRVTLEFSESVLEGDLAGETASLLSELSTVGYELSLDDVASGPTLLGNLHRLRLHELKVDAAFLRMLEVPERACGLVRSLVQLGHSLNMRVVAECVEQEAERATLAAMGCDHAQGHLFAFPMAATAITDLLTGQPAAVRTAPVGG